MNKLTKIGLTALAGSLVATSSMAGSLSATGAASMGLTNVSGTQTTQSLNAPLGGNGWSMGNSVTFAGSGDLDNGMTVSVSFELDNGAANGTTSPFDSHSLTLGMNEMGTLTFAGHGGSTVMGAWDDKTPTASEEAWDVNDNNAAAADDLLWRSLPRARRARDAAGAVREVHRDESDDHPRRLLHVQHHRRQSPQHWCV